MNFASFPYLCFLLFSLLLYFILGGKTRPAFLLLASYVFYSFFGLGFVTLMLFTTAVTFISAKFSYNAQTKNGQIGAFLIGLLIDLGVFILFKYVHIIDTDIMNWPGWWAQKVLIPIGISFYTFKTLGYCIDVYKRKYAPESSFVYYALSVSFFPQLIAGPIEKSHTLIQQFRANKGFEIDRVIDGGKLILWGLFKKLVIADGIAQIINPVFNNVENYKGLDLVFALFAFIYQIYADFSGYSDIAIGSARCFGIDLPANFYKPFFARNLFDFWRRWHITFYAWFKEYIYDNLFKTGRRSIKVVTALKIGFIFVMVGLWHGATANYLLYAMAAYFWMLLDFSSRKFRRKLFFGVRKWKFFLSMLSYLGITFMVASISIFFRPATLQDSLFIYKHLFSGGNHLIGYSQVAYLVSLILFFELMQSGQVRATGHCFERTRSFYLRALMYSGMLLLLILVSSRPDVTFQYFQF